MSLDATKPDSTTFLSEFSELARETRAALNAIEAETGVANTTLTFAGVQLNVGVDLSEALQEVVMLSGTGALTTMINGIEGMSKKFVCITENLSFIYNAAATVGGVLRLNSFDDLTASAGDSIEFVNIGGDALGNDGYWLETNRTLSV